MKDRDENDLLRTGQLPEDPEAGTGEAPPPPQDLARSMRVQRIERLLGNSASRLDDELIAVLDAALALDMAPTARAAALEKTLAAYRAKIEPPKAAPTFSERVNTAVETMFARAKKLERPIPTPWLGVNQALCGGLWPGLYTLSSASGMGKTQWGIQVALHAARSFVEDFHAEAEERRRQGLPETERTADRVAYIALELGDTDLVARLLGTMAAGAPDDLRQRGIAKPPKWSHLFFGRDPTGEGDPVHVLNEIVELFVPELRALPIHVETADAIGWSYLDLRKLAESQKPRLLVLDYSQLVSAPTDQRRREELRETIGNVAKVARDLARRHGMSVLALSSTARENYGRVDGTDGKEARLGPPHDPTRLIGLGKESGELEFTADCVLALARHPLTDADREGKSATEIREMEAARIHWLAIAKGRGFPPGWVAMRFDGSRFTCDDDAQLQMALPAVAAGPRKARRGAGKP